MKTTKRLLLLLVFAAAAAQAQSLDWSNDLDATLARARGERRLVLLHVRRECADPCNQPLDAWIGTTAERPLIAAAYRGFLLVRTRGAHTGELLTRITQQEHAPDGAVVLLDPSGRTLEIWKGKDLNAYADLLTGALRSTNEFLEAMDLRQKGDEGHAAMKEGEAFLGVHDGPRALESFEAAEKALVASRDVAGGQRAALYANFVRYRAATSRRTRDTIMVAMLRTLSAAVTKDVEAEAQLLLGAIAQSTGDRRAAIRAYRKVRALVPADSPLAKGATAELAAIGALTAEEQPQATSSSSIITILAPPTTTATGNALFVANVSPKVARVDFALDGVKVATATKPPFRAHIDLGTVPRLHAIRATAFDASGTAVAETSTTVNDRVDAFRVAIVSPADAGATGDVVVELDPSVPEGRRLRSVDLFLGETKVATLTQAPFRTPVTLPPSFAYLRAVATLDDGRTAEETRVYHSSEGFGETVDVRGVEFPAVIVGRDGKRIPSLTSDDVVVKDEGRRVAASLRDGTDEPSTIGIAIDMSTSMRAALLDVVELASTFVETAVSARDRMFVVAFDETPRVVQPATTNPTLLKTAIANLRPSGSTALVDAVTFTLQQFHGIGGKKALLLITDGDDVMSAQSQSACERMAREAGVPIYVVIPTVRRGSRRLGSVLEAMSNATGGTITRGPSRTEWMPLLTTIRDEIRGQYLLSFPGAPNATKGTWRRVAIDVPRRRAKVRAMEGYYAR